MGSLENGKTRHLAEVVDVTMAYKTFKYYAGWVDKIAGQTLSSDGPFFSFTTK